MVVILGGGRGTRLYPLTQLRSKPAVPLAGKFRLVDIPISNCINSGLRNIFVLSQFQSASLNRHVARTYRFDPFSTGFVEVLAAEQTEASSDWYQGTADAVRKQLHRFLRRGTEHILVLSGDQLYVMDFREILESHASTYADITVAATPVTESDASEFGILQIDSYGNVLDFVEKPRDVNVLRRLSLSEQSLKNRRLPAERRYLASMGIYVFRPEVLIDALEDPDQIDFGREVIPHAIHKKRVHSHFFSGYWEDIGTIRNFYTANLELATSRPPIDLFSEHAPIYTRARFLPGTCIDRARIESTIVADGSRIHDAEIDHCIVGIRGIIGAGVRLSHSVMMGADFYETEADQTGEIIPVGIGAGSHIENAIIDKNARIGEGVTILNREGLQHFDGPGYYIRDGLVVVPKNGVIPSGTAI